ncbi:unnamed protein product [Caenorhabditis auriculariae]|uniref:SH3 domain-containing protein n=1 Tax=Caenorhabditis auriculariae TaxID=2777116 RepID=A0A8S1HER0_9PELO|nr:unnamed protein product [Caenorhabditis auriculariae]
MDYLRVARPEPRAITPLDTASTVSLAGTINGGGGTIDGTSRQSTPSPITVAVLTTPQPPSSQLPTPARRSITPAAAADTTNPFGDDHDDVEETFENKVYPKLNAESQEAANKAIEAAKRDAKKEKDPTNPFDDDEDEEHHHDNVKIRVPETAPKDALQGVTKEPRKIVYKVRTTHEYKAIDVDELTFGPGIDINVLEAKDHDQLDEGWRLGELANGKRALKEFESEKDSLSDEFDSETDDEEMKDIVTDVEKDKMNAENAAPDTRWGRVKLAMRDWGETASFHGVPHIAQANTLIAFIVWTIVVAIAVVAFFLLITITVIQYFSFEKVVEVKLGLGKSAFPSITFCNINPYKLSKNADRSGT